MNLHESLQKTKTAFKANLKPGAILWVLMLLFFAAYAMNESFRSGLERISHLKTSIGYPFSFAIYVLFAALLPEILKVFFVQKEKFNRKNLENFVFVGIVFGFIGIVTDVFYAYQAHWFGEQNNLRTLILKASVDQGIYSPIANYLLVSLFFFRENGLRHEVMRTIFTIQYLSGKILPVVVAGWCIWIPGVMLVYSMPTPLQLPVAALILCFWVLIFTFVASHNQPVEAEIPG
ncbi:MAG: hypothetical protein ACOYXC_02050 [Candidatus Rifleibacteriota bacterium]